MINGNECRPTKRGRRAIVRTVVETHAVVVEVNQVLNPSRTTETVWFRNLCYDSQA